MRECWHGQPLKRPQSFQVIQQRLASILGDVQDGQFRKASFNPMFSSEPARTEHGPAAEHGHGLDEQKEAAPPADAVI